MISLAELEQQLLEVARAPRTKTAARETVPSKHKAVAAELLRDPNSSATGCFQAMSLLCGPEARAWEPETLWLTLDRQGVDLPVVNRDKVMAAVTLTMVPAFWWDVQAYENTALAFNNVVSNPHVMQEATPAQLAWGVYEAELIFSQQSDLKGEPEFDREPVVYTATVLHRAGYIKAPDLLSFAQRALDRLTKSGSSVTKDEVTHAWQDIKKQKLADRQWGSSALEVQLIRLASVELHIQERLSRYKADLQKLATR